MRTKAQFRSQLLFSTAFFLSTASNKSDYGLDELQNLNVKDRFSVFEHNSGDEHEKDAPTIEVKPSQNLLKKIKK